MSQKFYRCNRCGKIIASVKETPIPTFCCGQEMTLIVPGTTDASLEKHVPVYRVENNVVTVQVGSIEHPMLPEHFIEWISLETKFGNQRKCLKMKTTHYH